MNYIFDCVGYGSDNGAMLTTKQLKFFKPAESYAGPFRESTSLTDRELSPNTKYSKETRQKGTTLSK